MKDFWTRHIARGQKASSYG
jgi:hypothetical protein